MNSLQVFDYNGQSIQRRTDGYLSLNQMCNANGKLVADFLRLKSTKAYIAELSASMGIPIDEIVESKEGAMYGTWGHPLLALRCAQWISPKFAVWCDAHIFNLMDTGITSLKIDPLEEMRLKIQLADLERQKETAIAQSKQAELALTQFRHTITLTCPEPIQQKVLGYTEIVMPPEYRDRIIKDDEILNDGSTVTKTELCRRYGMTTKSGSPDYRRLNYLIERAGLQHKQDAWEETYSLKTNSQLKREFVADLDKLFQSGNQRTLFLGE